MSRPVKQAVVAAALLSCCFLPMVLTAEPPVERTIVQAVADADRDRILLRWVHVDGGGDRFTHYDVMRREFDQTALAKLNAQPIGSLTTVAEVEALFQQVGFEDALAEIQTAFGAGYAAELLLVGQATSDVELLQRVMLPDQNYGAAIALGLGYMDEAVVAGTTYVYELWGLDALGFRQERLGRAVATARAPDPLPQADAECAELGDVRAHMRAFVRWDHTVAAETRYIPSYDLFRVEADAMGACTSPNGPAAPGAVKVNPFPTQRVAPGRVVEGREQFMMSCASGFCHSAADPRATPPPTGVLGGTISSFERRIHPELWPNPMDAHHDTPGLRALSPETVRAVFDWLHEFHYTDGGEDTPSDPLLEGQTYCYSVLARDLLGQHGDAGVQAPCDVLDRDPPQVPFNIAAQRVPIGGTHEVCEISWDRNADATDDTVQYRVYRMTPDPPRASSSAPVFGPDPSDPLGDPPLATLAQPGAGDRVTHQDAGLDASNAGQRFFYAVTAVDDADGASDFSGWVPCVPRDIVSPPAPVASLTCCEDEPPNTGCWDFTNDAAWPGDRVLMWEPSAGNCIRIQSTQPDDTFAVRLYRSFDGVDYFEGPDFQTSTEDLFAPSMDARIFVRLRGFDPSGNFSLPSNAPYWFVILPPLPAPRIVDLTPVGGGGLVKVRFHSLPWTDLLGFGLYKHNLEPEDDTPADRGTFVVRYHDNNLSPNEYQTGWWAPLAAAQPLSALLPTSPPAGQDEFLYWDPIDNLYVMQADVEDREDLVLNLVAIGWSGREGQFESYRFEGTPGDGVLDWPKFRTTNRPPFALFDNLTATHEPGLSRVKLEWTAIVDGCSDSLNRPFIVFRRRGSATRWEQISPPFGCDVGDTAMVYHDYDVEPFPDGSPRPHHYTVIRLNTTGEFLGQHGPVQVDVP